MGKIRQLEIFDQPWSSPAYPLVREIVWRQDHAYWTYGDVKRSINREESFLELEPPCLDPVLLGFRVDCFFKELFPTHFLGRNKDRVTRLLCIAVCGVV